MATCSADLKLPCRRIARIRCLQECVDCFKHNKPLPEALCYVPAVVQYKATTSSKITVYSRPNKQSNKLTDLPGGTGARVYASGEDFCNSQGQWTRIYKFCIHKKPDATKTFEGEAWVLLYNSQSSTDDSPALVPILADDTISNKELLLGREQRKHSIWDEVVEHNYSLKLGSQCQVAPPHKEAVEKLRETNAAWSIEYDEELAQFLAGHTETDNENLGSIKNYVESIEVSSYCDDDGPNNMTDGDPDTYWESDGNQGQHWVRLKMKKGTIIKKLIVTIDGNDDNYMPYHITVMGGEMSHLKKLNDVFVDLSMTGLNDVCILQDQREHHPFIEIRIKECKEDGIDTRFHGIKIKSSKERDLGLSKELFVGENLVRYPRLESFDAETLYKRALILQRFVSLLDSVLPYIVPSWEYSVGSYSSLEIVRQLLPLSKKRLSLIETFLRESETGRPSRMPKLYINRRAAAEHRGDPSQDPECKNTVFNQIYEGLKPRDVSEKTLDYRWPSRHDQWWECKFLAEGIIDQGGGFRDSLSDLADELCPSANDVPVPLPFFIRSPNQSHDDSNVNRDMYIPNPCCKDLHKYEWIGKLMGGCLRGKESLVLSLPPFIWKKLGGERVTWSRDFVTVDAAEVRMIENMEQMDEDSFNAYFGNERTWSAVLSDGSTVVLKPEAGDKMVTYAERLEYCQLVQATRMTECDTQVEAMRQGLLKVIPQAVLDLLTWQELEKRVCGDPEITVEALKRTTHYEDLESTDTRVRYLWEALTNFSNEDRSRFLRFVTGRRRLPAPLYICPDKGEMVDALPESSTCSNTLYLPSYSNAKKAEDKLRYAAYNCVAIDTDMSPWDE